MKQLLLILLVLGTAKLHAQSRLQFDKHFLESEGRWVVFRPDSENTTTYGYGFVYSDLETVKLMLHFQGRFTVTPQGDFVPLAEPGVQPREIKLQPPAKQPAQPPLAFIPKAQFANLKITARPDWLETHKADSASAGNLARRGILYMNWADNARALPYLQQAAKMNPKLPGLAPILGYAYIGLAQYEQAVRVLTANPPSGSDDCNHFKALSQAQLELGLAKSAGETYFKASSTCFDDLESLEMTYNLARLYYQKRDKENFMFWRNRCHNLTSEDSQVRTRDSELNASLAKMSLELRSE